MQAGNKAGLIFILPQFIVMIVATIIGFIPMFVTSNATSTMVACCMAPAATGIVASVAGYLAYQWDPHHTVAHTGIMAGLVSGLGALLGAIVFWLIIGILVAYVIDDATLAAGLAQMPDLVVTGSDDIAAIRATLSVFILFMAGVGVVSGLISLSTAMLGGLIGAHLAKPQH